MIGLGMRILTLVAVMLFCVTDNHLECSSATLKVTQEMAGTSQSDHSDENKSSSTEDLRCDFCMHACAPQPISTLSRRAIVAIDPIFALFPSASQGYFSAPKRPPIA